MKKLLPALLLALLLLPHGLRAQERLLIVSDLHFTADSSASRSVTDAIVRLAADYDALLVLGDCANSGRPEEHAQVRAFLEQAASETGAAVYVLPGNHDLSGGFSPADFAAYYDGFGYRRSFSRDPSGAGYAAWTEGGTCLVMLDVNHYDGTVKAALHGAVREETLRWLRHLLPSLPPGTRTVVAGHYPLLPFSGSGSDDTENAAALAEVLREYSLPLYLCGHRHSNYTLHTDTLRQIAVGVPFSYPAWAGSLTPLTDGWDYQVVPIYTEGSPENERMANDSLTLARRMASGSLAGTRYEGDLEAEDWFLRVFTANMTVSLNDCRQALLEDENCQKWRDADVRSAVKPWILSLLENPQEDVRHVVVRTAQ